MPFDSLIGQRTAAANDEATADLSRASPYAPVQSTRAAHHHEQWRMASTNECWPFQPAAIASDAEVRYAHELRLRLRQRYCTRPDVPVCMWCVGVD